MARRIATVCEQQEIFGQAADFSADRGALLVAQRLVAALHGQFAHADHDVGDRIQRLIGQLKIGLGELGIAVVDFGQSLATRQRAQARRGDRIVGRAFEPFAAADHFLQGFGARPQRADLAGAALVKGSGAEIDHRPIPSRVSKMSLAVCIARPEA